MSDIFEQHRMKQAEASNLARESLIQKTKSDTPDYTARAEAARQELQANKDRYAVTLAPEEYEILNNAISNAEIPEDEAYRWASALEMSKQFKIEISDAYRNLEEYSAAIWGKEKGFVPKTNFKAIVDYGTLGVNTVKQGQLGVDLMAAEIAGDEEKIQNILAQIDAIDQENISLQDAQDRRWYIEALKFGAQSAPFTGYVATAGLLGGLVSGGLGTGLAFAASMQLASGQEYIDLRREGATKENALAMSVFSGSLQAVVETAMGNVAGTLGKNALGAGAKEAISEKLTGQLFKRLHYSGTFKQLAVKMGTEYVKENFEEGMEEVVQDLISKGTHALAAELEDYEIEPMTAESIAKDAWENFYGGIMGSLVLGLGSTAVNTAATAKDYKAIKDAASIIPSEEGFKKAVENSPVFENYSEEEKAEAIKNIYKNNSGARDESIQKSAEGLAEAFSADERMEAFTVETDEDGNEIPGTAEEITEEVRDEDGKLYNVISDPSENEDGTYSTEMTFGDPNKENANNYGYIEATINDDNNTVTIDSFKTSKERGYLRNEMFADFANNFSGYEIKWDPKTDYVKGLKEEITALNPRGKDAGLNYFEVSGNTDQATRVKIAQELRSNLNSQKVTNEMIAPLVAEFEALGNTFGLSVSDFYNQTFNGNIFGDVKEAQESALSQGKGAIRGGIKIDDSAKTIQGLRAVIYAAENADFSTFSHELAHLGRRMAEVQNGALSEEINNAFGIDENGWTREKEELFAEAFEDYLHTGEAKTPGLKELFQKLAEFLVRTYHQLHDKITLSDDMKNVYDQLLKGDADVLRMAEEAVKNGISETSENITQESDNAENITKSGENITESEVDSEEEIELLSDLNDEEFQILVDSGSVTEETAKAVKETKLDNITQEAVASIIDDPDLTPEQKSAAVLKANGEDYIRKQENIERYQNREDLTEEEKKQAIDDILNNRTTERDGSGYPFSTIENGKDIFFQIIGEKGAKALDEANEETIRMDNKKIAEEMEAAGKDAKTIRLATGWERGKDKKWRYEISDLENKFDLIYKTVDYRNTHKGYVEYEKKINEEFEKGNWHLENILSPMDLQIFEAYQDEANKYYYKDYVQLKDILDAPELYKAYPQLKEMGVYFENKPGDQKAAYVRGYDMTLGSPVSFIEINETPNDYNETKLANILLHEIQHAIQRYEGFAVGGSPEIATEIAQKAYDAFQITWFYSQLEDQFAKNKEKYSYNQIALLDDIKKEYAEADMLEFLPSEELMTKAFNYWVRGYGIEEQQKIVEDNELDKYLPTVDKEGYWNYRRLAGEVEARNVQRRADLTVEERRNQLLSETEDKTRASQLVHFDEDNNMLFQEAEDAEYEEAVNSGNTEKAEEMLLSKATKNGYIKQSYFGEGSWAAPSAVVEKEDFNNLEALQNYLDDFGGEVNIYGIINGIQGHDEDYYFNPSRAGFHGQAASDTAQVYRKLKYDKAGPDTKVTVYRAIPNEINGEKLLSGDWIALSENYCKEHGNNRYGKGKYHIIKNEVEIKNIWQGEEDMREFGFDDGNKDVEKNVSNNRKLLEITYDENGKLIPLSERFNENNPSILFQEAEPGTEFQTVYHGSPHILRKSGGTELRGEELGFDHSKMGTGEGVQAFGWGSYVTQVQGIAEDYAKKLSFIQYTEEERKRINEIDNILQAPSKIAISLESKKDFLSHRKSDLKNLDNGKYEARINKNIKEFTKELKIAQKEKDERSIKFYEDLINTSYEDLNENHKEKLREAFNKDIEKTNEELSLLKSELKKAQKIYNESFENLHEESRGITEKAIARPAENVYTLEIPEDGENYLQWDKAITPEQYQRIVNQAEAEDLKLYSGEDQYSVSDYGLTTTDGEKLYKELIKETKKKDKEISEFLNRAGFTGISYPANATTGGRKDGARNFVIFNENDISIKEWHGKDINGNILFQTDEDILNEAAQFDSWQEYRDFMEATDMEGKVPQDAGADWYLNTWEIAHNVSPTTAERNAAEMQERKAERDASRRDPVMVDAEWYTMIQKPGNLENFLKNVYQATHIDEQEMASLNADEAAYVQDIVNRAERMFHHGIYSGNIRRVMNGKELTDKARSTIINLMGQRKRDYRAIYADITGQSEYSVEQSDLQKENANIAKDALRYKLITYASEVDSMSPEEKTKLLNQIKDEQVREKFKKDKVKMVDPDVEHYIDMQESAIKNLKKDIAEQRTEFNDDVNRFASKQERDIIKQYEAYLNAKSEAEFKKIPLPKGSKNAEKVGEAYKRQVEAGMNHSFSGMVMDWDAYKTELEANVRLQERLRAENKLSELEEKIKEEYDAKRVKTLMSKAERLNAMAKEYTQKQEELAAAKKLREMRKSLVKRVMRRVSFNSIDYNNAKQIIAVQKVFDPNLRGGVNKWIGTENKMAREIWSAWNTDYEAKERMQDRLSKRGKTDIIRILENTKTEEDFENLTKKELKAIEKAMPRQDWVKELNLDLWKEERDNALQLPIKEITENKYVTQPDGTKKSVEVTRAEFPSEIEEMLVNAIGQDMTYAIQYKHFEDWTTGEMEELARRMDRLFKEGRDMLAARKEAEKLEADRIRNLIRDAINNTGIVINEDDPEDVKKKKQDKINKILGVNQQFPGTVASIKEKEQTFIDRLLHSYHDANVRRVARILDNYAESTMTNLLYWQENDCFNKEARAKDRRNIKIDNVIDANKLDMRKLANVIDFMDRKITWDEVLMIWAAKLNQDDYFKQQLEENEALKELFEDKPEVAIRIAKEESAYKAIKYGNMILDTEREAFRKMDEEVLKAERDRLDKLHAAELAADEEAIKQFQQVPSDMVDENGNLIMIGTNKLKTEANSRFNSLLAQTKDIYNEFKPLVDAIRKDYAEEFDRINAVSIKEFNAPVWREKWYLPLVRRTAAGDTHEQRLKQDLLGHSAGTGKAGTEKGFTKKRVEIGPMNQTPVELGLYTTWADSVERNEHFIAYAAYIRELNRVLFSRDAVGTMQEIENRYGKAMKDYLDVYVKEVANPNISEPKKGLDKVMHMMRGNTAPAYLGWKFSSVLKQGIESPAPFMQFINPVEYMHGAIKLATDKSWTRESIGQKSAFMKSRVFDPIADLINENVEKSFNKKSYYLKKFQQKGMEGLEWIDWACVAPGWIAIYEKEYARLQETEQAQYDARVEELTEQNDTRYGQYRLTEEQIRQQAHDDVTQNIEEAAVKKADDCVRLCQPSNRKVDLAPMFKNNSEAAKAVLQFQTALNVIWQNIRYDIPYAVRNKEYRNIIGMVLGYVMAGVMSGVVTEGLLKGGDDGEDPEEIAKKLGYYSTTQFIDSVPIVGGNLDGLAKKAITGSGNGMYTSSIWPTFDKYFNSASALVSGDWDKALWNMEQGLMLTTGLPLSGIKELEAVAGIDKGILNFVKDENAEAGFHPEALAGRR